MKFEVTVPSKFERHAIYKEILDPEEEVTRRKWLQELNLQEGSQNNDSLLCKICSNRDI